MRPDFARHFAPRLLAFLALVSTTAASATPPPDADAHRQAVHVLNRLAYGPRPGDVERVTTMGVDAYIREQLNPQAIDDAAVEKQLAAFETLQMSSKKLGEAYFADIKRFLSMQAAAGNMEDMKMRYGVDPKVIKGDKKATTKPAAPALEEVASWEGIRAVGELQQAKLIRAASSNRQLQEVLVDFWTNHFNVDVRKDACRAYYPTYDREAIRPNAMGRFRDLLGAVAHSPAMLTYLDNQENSVDRKITAFERTLAEWYIGHKLGIDATGMVPDRTGPNENYARELLELHTLGVDGGYTQKDVQEVARCFSGWGVSPFNGKFGFDKNKHDDGPKVVLGLAIAAGGGERDGDVVLDILAAHPATARFISRKLCQRFVADDPPAELVEAVSAVYVRTKGDVREVVRAIVTSEQFRGDAARRAKVKSPLEYAASAVRATGAAPVPAAVPLWRKLGNVREGGATLGHDAAKLSGEKRKSLNWHVFDMGQPLLAHAAPTGYPEASKHWVSPGALIGRINFSLALSEGNVSDVAVDLSPLLKGVDADQPEAVVDRLAVVLLHGELTPGTRGTVLKAANPDGAQGKTVDAKKVAALLLGSPEFQRR